jgi:hypothetical protein
MFFMYSKSGIGLLKKNFVYKYLSIHNFEINKIYFSRFVFSSREEQLYSYFNLNLYQRSNQKLNIFCNMPSTRLILLETWKVHYLNALWI